MSEVIEWLFECREVFPKLDKFAIEGIYAPLSCKLLGRMKGAAVSFTDIDAARLLLEGIADKKRSLKSENKFQIEVNQNLQKIGPIELRKQVVQHVLLHELMHIDCQDHIVSAKSYARRKRKKFHTKEFEAKIHEKYNQLRKAQGLPEITNADNVHLAVNKIASKVLK